MSKETLIQSQLVKITGPVEERDKFIRIMSRLSQAYASTVTLTPTSVPDATVGVTQDSQQNPRQALERAAAFIRGLRDEVFSGSVKGITGRQQRDGDEVLRLIETALYVTEQSQQNSRQDGEA